MELPIFVVAAVIVRSTAAAATDSAALVVSASAVTVSLSAVYLIKMKVLEHEQNNIFM